MVKWETICKSKKKGGLGIKDLKRMNISLLCKWWWKLEREGGLWQHIVKYKYMQNKTIHEVEHRLSDSPMWADLLKVKIVYLQGRGVITNDGSLTRFWLDPWVYDKPLAKHAPILFALCENKKITVAQALHGEPALFRRWLHSEIRTEWETIWGHASRFHLKEDRDVVIWTLGVNKKFWC